MISIQTCHANERHMNMDTWMNGSVSQLCGINRLFINMEAQRADK